MSFLCALAVCNIQVFLLSGDELLVLNERYLCIPDAIMCAYRTASVTFYCHVTTWILGKCVLLQTLRLVGGFAHLVQRNRLHLSIRLMML